VGGVVGLVVTGVLVGGPDADYHRPFWVGLGVSAASLVLAALLLPRRPPSARGRVDAWSAVVLGAGLVLFLLPLSQGSSWGWASPATLGLLAVALLATRLVAPLSAALRSVATLRAPGISTTLPLLYSPGFWLAAVATVATVLLRLPRSGLALALRLSWRQWLPTALGTVGFVVLGQLMAASGMTAELAAAAARLGNLYAGAVPALGALGGFVTGSNTGANAMLAAMQGEGAARLGLSTTFVVALQNTAAANATMATPSRVLLSLAVTGLAGVERRELEPLVTRRILAIVLGTLAILALAGLGYAAAR
jgi:L-lactate permease